MSGPKVVKVFTKEEQISMAQSSLARLDKALETWETKCSKWNQLSDHEIQKVLARRDALKADYRAGNFSSVFEKGALEIDFLKSDTVLKRQAAVESSMRERAQVSSGRENAAFLIKVLKEKIADADSALLQSLDRAASGQLPNHQVDQLLAQALALLTKQKTATLSAAQREQANRLSLGQTAQTLEQWKASRLHFIDPRIESIQRISAEIALLGYTDDAAAIETRLRSLSEQINENQHGLWTDSLLLDTRALKDRCLEIEHLKSMITLLTAELIATEVDTVGWLKSIDDAFDGNNKEALQTLLAQGQFALNAAVQARAAHARRKAILHGLTQLGYTVREGMSTSLVADGRLIFQKADLPGYGVEVAGGTANDRLQVRAVALSSSRDTTRDIDAETIWCQDFTKLRSALKANGDELTIEKMLPVGAVPLQVVEFENQTDLKKSKIEPTIQKRQP